MARKNYYAVKVGKTPGIYRTWEECRRQTEQFSSAVYKGFATEAEARQFMGDDVQESVNTTEVEKQKNVLLGDGEALAYVDGSYREETGEYGCGVVLFYDGMQMEFSEKGKEEDLAVMRNVAGEIMGARLAMEEALRLGALRLTIVHDYQGIASWCTGEWRTNKEGTKAYKEYFDSLQGRLTVSFEKVKGHSGDVYNELADRLAKSSIFDDSSLPVRKNTSVN